MIRHLDGTVVECNTAYEGSRNTTEKHLKTIEKHGWSRYFDVDLLDAEGPDLVLGIPGGKVIQKTMSAKILRTIMVCLSYLISKDIQWEDMEVL